jgi:hypothetical protein
LGKGLGLGFLPYPPGSSRKLARQQAMDMLYKEFMNEMLSLIVRGLDIIPG